MSEREIDQLTLVELLLLATNEKIQADLAKRLEWHEKPAKMGTREIIPAKPPQTVVGHSEQSNAVIRPCPACRNWARRRKALRTFRCILVGMALAAVVVGLIWLGGEAW